MPAKTKAKLVTVSTKEFAKLDKLVAEIDDALARAPHPEDGLTIKDTIAHRVHWIGLFFGWYEGGVAGRPVHVPAEGYKWNQLKAYNAKVRAEMADLSWDEVKVRLQTGHDRLMGFIDSCSDADLYGPPARDWQGSWTLGRWAEASGPSHYRSAAKYIREIRRKLAA